MARMSDMRCQVHSYYLEEGIYKHNTKKCPLCIINYYLNGEKEN